MTSRCDPEAKDSRAFVAEISRLAAAPARPVGEVRILCDGAAAFPAMIGLIEAARETVEFENFIFAGDATGQRFARALAEAARRGVDVRVMYDPVGTMMVRGGSNARVLREEGVEARAFRPLSPYAPWSWTRLRHRDHRKTLTVDGEVAVVGGLCISDHWAPTPDGGGGWRDTALMVKGPLVTDVRAAFERMWAQRAGGRRGAGADGAGVIPPAGWVVADEPGRRCVARLYEWLARRARTTLEITDAYLVAPPPVLAAFKAAAERGVDVRLLLPGRNNHPLAGAAARRSYETLMASGVRIYEWEGAMVHAKTAVVDGEIVLVGSSNLDSLSMRRNFELNLLIADAATGGGMRRVFARDLERARPVDPAAWRRRPVRGKLAERIAAIFDRSL